MARYPTRWGPPREPEPNAPPLRSSRGEHPDLTDDGDIRWEAYLPRFDRQYAENPEQVTANIAREQRQLPREIQELVSGRSYGSSPTEGLRAYREDVAWGKQWYAEQHGKTRFVMDSDVPTMSDAEYDAAFDANGQPRADTLFWQTDRGVRTDSAAIDPWSARELAR